MPRPSLKARGVQLLAQRDHSRSELRAKLLRHAEADAKARAVGASDAVDAGPEPTDPPSDEAPPESPATAVDRTLDWLEAHRYLDEARFVDSRIHARAARFGNMRIRQELARHGVAPSDEALAALKSSELDRARSVWARKFGTAPADAQARAKQMRFLAGRGFSAEVIRRVVGGEADD